MTFSNSLPQINGQQKAIRPRFTFRNLLVVIIIACCSMNCNSQASSQMETPQDQASIKGDSLLAEVFALYGLVDSSSRMQQWYHTEEPEKAMKLAEMAEKEYLKQLPSLTPDGSDYIECLRKLALSAQFQSREFSYQKSLPPTYERAMGYITQAIALQKKMRNSSKLAELYETAARIAKPHFYFGYQSEISAQADAKAERYLDLAQETYGNIGDVKSALGILRTMKDEDVKSLLWRIKMARRVEGDSSLELGRDIAALMHAVNYEEVFMEDIQPIFDNARLGKEIFGTHKLSNDEAGRYRSFLYDAGNFFATKMWDLDTSNHYLQQAQTLEQKWGMELDYTASQLAANYIQQQKWAAATAQYDIALTSSRLAVIDVEQAYFGKAMVAWISGNHAKAIQIWKQNIRDQEIMNGISSYQSRFIPENKAMIRENALTLIDAVGAPNARRIVETGWEK